MLNVRLRVLAAIVLCLPLAGCGAAGPLASLVPSGSPPLGTTPGAATPTGTGAPTAASVDMCALMSLGEVQGASPFATPLAEVIPGVTPGMCEYRSADDADEPVGVLLVVTDFATPEGARAHMTAYRENFTNAGVTLSDVDGVGDDAVSSGTDEVGVHAITGRYALDANLGGEWPDTTDASKVTAGINLLRQVISRLP